MITYDHLWWIKSTYDGRRRLKILFWRKPALTPTKNYENKTVCVFFQAASHRTVKTSRNIGRKSKNEEKLNFLKSNFWKFEISSGSMPRCIFWRFPPPEHFENTLKTRFFQNYDFYVFFWFLYIFIYICRR